MSVYDAFADVYDKFMPDAPTEDWIQWLSNHFTIEQLKVADVGCGTGRLACALAKIGAVVVGIDNAEQMLAQAAAHAVANRVNVTWLCQDMRRLRLPGSVDVVLSTCDALNYIPTHEELRTTFERIFNSLQVQGKFCFDLLGPRRLEMLRDGISYDFSELEAVVFETDVDDKRRISFDVHLFKSFDGELYRRYEEHHIQQFYAHADVVHLLQEVGFEVEFCVGDFDRTPIHLADRIVFQACRL